MVPCHAPERGRRAHPRAGKGYPGLPLIHEGGMPPLFVTPNTVELVPTLGALFPRCGPVQDPVHASLLCEPRRVSCEGLHPQDMCAALGARATVSAVATTAPPLLLSHVTRGDTPPHPRFPPTRLRERVLY